MRKIIAVLMVMALVTGAVFANSVSSETGYDLDAETFNESLAVSLAAGPVTASFGTVFTNIPDAIEVDVTANVAIALGIMTLSVATSYGVDGVDNIPLTITAGFQLSEALKLTAVYGFDNVNGDVVEIGKATVKVEYTW